MKQTVYSVPLWTCATAVLSVCELTVSNIQFALQDLTFRQSCWVCTWLAGPGTTSWVIVRGFTDNYSVAEQIKLLRASSYEPGNRTGSVTGTKFIFCSYGQFQPSRPGWNSRNKTKMVKHKLLSFATVVALWTLVTLLIGLIRILLKWKYTDT